MKLPLIPRKKSYDRENRHCDGQTIFKNTLIQGVSQYLIPIQVAVKILFMNPS